MTRKLNFLKLIAVFLVFTACNRVGGNSFVPAPSDYISDTHTLIFLKRPLREISGIDFINNQSLIAINDEDGRIFSIDPADGNFEFFEFGKKGDYEDVVRVNDRYYVLDSKGSLYEVSATEKRQLSVYENDFGKQMEFESLCYDKLQNQLLLICKECGKNQQSIDAFRFELNTKTFSTDPYFSISWAEIRKMAKDNSIECKPSAAAINPVNGKLYIIASVGKVLLMSTPAGKLEQVFGLNPDHFSQPEGITFGSNGDMYISNEGVQGKASLLKFSYKGENH